MPVEGWLLVIGLLAVWCFARAVRMILGLLALCLGALAATAFFL